MIDTAGVTGLLTVIVIAFEVAVADVTQVSELVNTQVTMSPLFRDALVYVALFVPTLAPFNFH